MLIINKLHITGKKHKSCIYWLSAIYIWMKSKYLIIKVFYSVPGVPRVKMEGFAGRDQWKPILNFDFKNCNKFRILCIMTIKETLDGFHKRNAINTEQIPYLK